MGRAKSISGGSASPTPKLEDIELEDVGSPSPGPAGKLNKVKPKSVTVKGQYEQVVVPYDDWRSRHSAREDETMMMNFSKREPEVNLPETD